VKVKVKLKYRVHDWWHLTRPVLVCRLFGHKAGNGVRKFGGEILCRRCSQQTGRWGV